MEINYEIIQKEISDPILTGYLLKLRQISVDNKSDRSVSSWFTSKWRRRFFVLRRSRMSKIGIIDYYENDSAWKNKKSKKGSMILFPNFRVISCNQQNSFSKTNFDKEYVFEVIAQEKILRMAADSETALDTWVQKIQRMATLKPSSEGNLYTVHASDSPSMNRLGITGITRCFLWLCSNGIILAEKDSQSIIAIWSYRCLRGYNCTGINQFAFESGRRSLMGQGEYQFYTKGQDNTEIKRLIKQSIAYKFTLSDDENKGSLRSSASAFNDYDKIDNFIEYSVGFNRSTADITIKSPESVTSSKSSIKHRNTSQPIATPTSTAGDSALTVSMGSYKQNEWNSIKNMRLNNSGCRYCCHDKASIGSSSSFSICPNCQLRSIPDRNPVYDLEDNAYRTQPRHHRDSTIRASVDSESSLSISCNSQQIEDKFMTTSNPDKDEYATFYNDSNTENAPGKLAGAKTRHANLQDPETMYAKLENAATTHTSLEETETIYASLAASETTYARLEGTETTYAKLEDNEIIHAKLDGTEDTYAQLQDMQDTPMDTRMEQQLTNVGNHQKDSCRSSKGSYCSPTSTQDVEYETFHLPQDFETIVTVNVNEAIYDNLSEPFISNQSEISYDDKDLNHGISPHIAQSARNIDSAIVDKSRQLMDNETNNNHINDAVCDSFTNTTFER